MAGRRGAARAGDRHVERRPAGVRGLRARQARVSCVLGLLKGLLGAPQEHAGVVLGAQHDEAGVEPGAIAPVVVDTAAQCELKTAVEALGVRPPGLGMITGEEAVAEMGRNVGSPDSARILSPAAA